jgi:pimeloyl-ACP methyl ester carboxylesterase
VSALYPPVEPYETGTLDVGDGHSLYWEVSGDPDGKPAVVLHGGHGSGSSPGMRRYFDPARYRIVLFDQRNSGRNVPSATGPHVDLSTNTTAHLVADVERLREHLGVDHWLVWGGSWGVTLAFVHAQAHPERVTELVLAAITNGSRREVDWITRDMDRVFPREWEQFRDGVPAADPGRGPGRRRQPVAARRRPGGPREGRPGLVRLGGRARLPGAGRRAVPVGGRPGVPARPHPHRRPLLGQWGVLPARRSPAV